MDLSATILDRAWQTCTVRPSSQLELYLVTDRSNLTVPTYLIAFLPWIGCDRRLLRLCHLTPPAMAHSSIRLPNDNSEFTHAANAAGTGLFTDQPMPPRVISTC